MCFVVFCDVLRVLCECFASGLQYFYKTHEKHRKTVALETGKHKKLTICSCIAGVFQEPKIVTVLHKTPFTKHLQNTAKHSQNSHNTRFAKLRRKMHAKRSKPSQNHHKIQPQYVILRAFGVFSQIR